MSTSESPTGPSAHDAVPVFGRRDHCNFRLSKMAWCPARRVMLSVFRWASREKPYGMSLFDYLEGRGFTKTMLRKQFNKRRYATVQADLMGTGETYDVTLLQLSITLVRASVSSDPLNPRITTPGDPLEDHLQTIKNFRNDVMHDAFGISNEEFIVQTEKLREHLTKALESAREAFDVDQATVDGIIEQMNHEINSIRDEPLVEFDLTSYQNQRLLPQLRELLHESGRSELLELYSERTHFNPLPFFRDFKLSLPESAVFTPMTLVECGDSPTSQIDYEDILDFIDKKTISNQRSASKIAMIEGLAGVGKSSLMRYMVADWVAGSDRMRGLKNYHLLLYVQCRNSFIASLLQLLKVLMPKTSRKFRAGDLVEVALGLNLLILIDGLDEMNDASTDLLKEILNLKRTGSITVICSTRPEMMGDFLPFDPEDLTPVKMKALGIPEESRVAFVTKYHDELRKSGKSTQRMEGLAAYLRNCPRHIQEEMRVPVNLVFLSVMWVLAPSEVNEGTTMTELHLKILEMKKEKLLERLKWNRTIQFVSIQDLRRKVEFIFRKVCRESLTCMKEGLLTLSENRRVGLTRACLSVGLPFQEIISSFLAQEETWTPAKPQSRLRFGNEATRDLYSALFVLDSLSQKDPSPDASEIISEIRILTERQPTCQWSAQDVVESIKKRLSETSSGPETRTIMSVLEIHPDDFKPGKCLDLLTHLAALVRLDGGSLERDTAEELVTLLQSSGLTESKQWLELLTKEKCGPTLIQYIGRYVQDLLTGDVEIEDSSVGAYAALLPQARPETVLVDIKGDPRETPLLPEMLTALAQHDCRVRMYLRYDFSHPGACDVSIDTTLQLVFKRCKVLAFEGQLSGAAVSCLPTSIQELSLGICGDDLTLTSALSSLWSRAQLSRLELQVRPGIALSSLPSQLPNFPKGFHLRLCDLDATHGEWADQVIQHLRPQHGNR
ncbi:uncharacterized protein [Panulirus ornatus]|uniref:uncharacterized protein isoform X2 n=1 Tax=Panulirus ornatus TaxID=150431 RepID=UPI003A8B46CB